jgi:propionate CoA-transferase
MLDRPIAERLEYDAETRSFFVDFEGMSVRDRAQIADIRDRVAAILQPLGFKVRAVVNYEAFSILPELVDDYTAMVADLAEHFYSTTTRYTTNGFLRAKLADAGG